MPREPYLAKKRDAFYQLVNGLVEEIAKGKSPEEIEFLFMSWRKSVWRSFLEPSLKESFGHGEANSGAGSGRVRMTTSQRRRINPRVFNALRKGGDF